MFPDEDLSLDLTSDDENDRTHDHHSSASRRLSYHHSSNTPLSGAGSGAGSGNYSFPSSGYHRNSDQAVTSGRKKISRTTKSPLTSGSSSSAAGASAAAAASAPSSGSTPEVKIQTSGTNGTCTIKSGYITCPVCSCTKFYTTLQRRYGQFSCVGCYRFFKEFFVKPKRYGCPNLGTCPLDVRTKCKGCWIQKCIETYSVDEQRKSLLTAHRPVRKGPAAKSSVKQEPGSTTGSLQQVAHQQQQQSQQQHRVAGGGSNSHNNNNNNNSNSNNFNNNSSSSPGIDSGNENIEPDADGMGEDEDEDEEDEDQQYSSNQHQQSGPEAKRIKTEPMGGDMGAGGGSMNGTDDDENNSLLEEEDPDPEYADNNNKTDSNHHHQNHHHHHHEGSSLLLPAGSVAAIAAVTGASDPDLAFDSPSSSSNMMERDLTPPLPTRSGKTPPRRKTSGRIKNWCCLKCANCLADDCGKCINCLDRPKFGGPFIRKQRCLYKKCLMKTKPIPNNSSF